jgi:pre-rRNA-processing protein TSR1
MMGLCDQRCNFLSSSPPPLCLLSRKDSLILCVGPRRLRVNPIYSQHTRGGGKGANNVHKFERFLRHGVTSIATTYGPVVFGKQPCVLLKETTNMQGKYDSSAMGSVSMSSSFRLPIAPQLVAMGSFMNPDTTRVIAKRIILTGHPFKVHKKTATVRYMFFNSGKPLGRRYPPLDILFIIRSR